MGRKGSWFSAVKKVFGSDSRKDQKNHRSKTRIKCLGYYEEPEPSYERAPIAVAPPLPPKEDVKLKEAENGKSKQALSLALATAVAAGAAVAAAQAAAEVVRLTAMTRHPGKMEEEVAAIKIQTAFRGYLGRRGLHALRGLGRLKTLVKGQYVKRQVATTLRCMQTLARVQSQIRERRIRMSEENRALERQLLQKHEKELEKLQAAQQKQKVGEEWNHSAQSKEQIEAKLLNRQEAAVRRERALAYAVTHQQTWKNSSKPVNSTMMDPNNPHWGWSWLERWMAGRPWEGQSTVNHKDHASAKSAASQTMSVGEITKLYSLRDDNDGGKPSPPGPKARPLSHNSPSTPPSIIKAPSSPSANAKARTASTPKGRTWSGHDDSRSMLRVVQSEGYRRHSIGGSPLRDETHMAPTKLAKAKAKSRMQGPSGMDRNGTPEKEAPVSAKKWPSFPASQAGSRRSSGLSKVDKVSNKDVATLTEE